MSDDFASRIAAALAPAYVIERELGGGGMSRVFLARDQALGRRVVVKMLPPELAAGVNAERFRREIRVAAALMHPHIVAVHQAAETADGILYYADFSGFLHALDAKTGKQLWKHDMLAAVWGSTIVPRNHSTR